MWKCSTECKTVTDEERHAIMVLKKAFDGPIEELRYVLETCDDDCPNPHYQRMVHVDNEVCNDDSDNSDDENENYFNFCDIQGHPLSCHTGNECQGQLRILRAASVHYAVLRKNA